MPVRSRLHVTTAMTLTYYCACARCICRRDVKEKGEVCRECAANLHEGRPRDRQSQNGT